MVLMGFYKVPSNTLIIIIKWHIYFLNTEYLFLFEPTHVTGTCHI